ncbi:hypothetical protein MYX84_00880 [Acidobacteria bacterium AH-259-O06]|nr:hypothetical protein [Acidobacteria bacterium AH-259-O06]
MQIRIMGCPSLARRSREYNRMLKGVLGIAAQAARPSQDNELVTGNIVKAKGKAPPSCGAI